MTALSILDQTSATEAAVQRAIERKAPVKGTLYGRKVTFIPAPPDAMCGHEYMRGTRVDADDSGKCGDKAAFGVIENHSVTWYWCGHCGDGG